MNYSQSIFFKAPDKQPIGVKFSFTFIALFPPFIVNNLKLSTRFTLNKKKILIKQSYMLLTWFYYLSFTTGSLEKKGQIRITTLPSILRKFTGTRAPMAHKTNSKEQFQLKYYKFKVKFNTDIIDDNFINSVDAGVLCVFITKKLFPVFETNLIFLKTHFLSFFVMDSNYFNFYKFLKSF